VTGEPPLPGTTPTTLPACASTTTLGKNCSINNLSATGSAYAYIMLPAGAKNLKLFTSGGTGDVDLYVKNQHGQRQPLMTQLQQKQVMQKVSRSQHQRVAFGITSY